MVDLVLINGKLVTSSRSMEGWLAVENGRVAAIGTNDSPPKARRVIDVSGKYVLPGLVDPEMHPVPPLEGTVSGTKPGQEMILTESKAAIAAGITTQNHMLPTTMWTADKYFHQLPVEKDEVPSMLDAFPGYLDMTKRSYVDFFLSPIVVNPEQIKEIPEFTERHGITSYKIYLQCLTGEKIWDMWPVMPNFGFYYQDDGFVFQAMQTVAQLGEPAILRLHCENWEIARVLKANLIEKFGPTSDPAYWNEASPGFCEAGHVRTYAYYARIAGCPLYVQHVTCQETIAEVQKARAEGTTIIGQTGPHYLTLDAGTWLGNPPLRKKETFPILWEAVQKGHGIDTMGSDHVSLGRPLKEIERTGLRYAKDIWTTYEGFESKAEDMLRVLLHEGVNKGRLTLERLVAVCCENPARAFGLYPKKGTLEPGADADLVVVDLERRHVLTRDMILTGQGWSIHEGKEFVGWPVMTFLRGRLMMEWPADEPRPLVVGEPIGEHVHGILGHSHYPIDG